jgi:hypothetical protein
MLIDATKSIGFDAERITLPADAIKFAETLLARHSATSQTHPGE